MCIRDRVRAFESRVEAATTSAQIVDAGAASPDILAMIGEHQMALGGVGVIIAAQITRKIMTSVAQRISQRVAGRIAGRVLGRVGTTVVPLAGWIIGAGMIAYDPVSYTHLDVYKRQTWGRAPRGRRAGPGPHTSTGETMPLEAVPQV